MFGKAFGRRTQQQAKLERPTPDADGVTRLIPKEIWDGPQGNFLRNIGMTPDDPSNLAPTPHLMQARADAAKADQDRFLTRVNAGLPEGVSVVPWAMIPWTCWQGPSAAFLMIVCEYFPAQQWNTFLLAENERSAFVLQLPLHPGVYPAGLESGANENLAAFHAEFSKAHDGVDKRMQAGDIEALEDHRKAARMAQGKVVAMANAFASIAFGEKVYDHHLELFGRTLGWSHADALLAKRK